MTVSNIFLVVATTCTALIAGLLYSYSCSVMLGLKTLPDAEFIGAMQSINRAIQNPVFFISFMGALLLLPVTTFLNYTHPLSLRFWLLFTATMLYLIGVFGVTAFGNVPLNNALEKFNLHSASPEAIASQRMHFEATWNNLHTIRTVSAIISLILVIIGCISKAKD